MAAYEAWPDGSDTEFPFTFTPEKGNQLRRNEVDVELEPVMDKIQYEPWTGILT